MAQAIPTIHFDTDLLPVRERLPRWGEAMSAYDMTAIGEGGPEAFRAKSTVWWLGGLVVARGRLSPLRFERSTIKARADQQDNISFLLLTRGAWTGDLDGRPLQVGPGQLVGFDRTRPVTADSSDNEHISVVFPRRTIQEAMPGMPDLHGRIMDGVPGRLLVDHFLALVRYLPLMTTADVPAMTKATASLVAGCVEALPKREPEATEAIRARVRFYIDQHLASPDLHPERIRQDLALSRSTLYRAFKGVGGVAAYIQDRRLEAAHILLGDPEEHRKTSTIAFSLGFVSASHFSAAFRQRFGYTPGEAREEVGRAVGEQAGVGEERETLRFRAWMERLTER